jgi:peroxiredoxin
MREISTLFGISIILALSTGDTSFAQEGNVADLDKDNNDKVTVAEFKEYAGEKLAGLPQLDEFAKKVDADNNGEISQDEFDNRMDALAAVREAGDKDGEAPMISDEDQAMIEDAKVSLVVLQKSLESQDWDKAKAMMTKRGQEDFCSSILLFAGAFSDESIQEEMGLPEELLEQIGGISEVLEKYKIEIDMSSVQSDEAARKVAAKALEGAEDPWELIDELWSASKDIPFFSQPLLGNIDSTQVEDGTVLFELSSDPEEQPGGEGGMQVMIMSPPTFVIFESVDDNWKYAGVHTEKTEAAMEEFMNGMEMGEGGFDMSDLEPNQMDDASFTGKTVDGDEVSLADYSGKVVLIDFWGTWCQPCVAEFPGLQILHEELNQHGFEIVGIAADDSDALNKFFEKKPLSWKNVVDAKGELSDHFGVKAYPTTLLIDKEGKHVSSNLSKADLIEELATRLNLDPEVVKNLKSKLKSAKPKRGDSDKKSDRH